MSTPLVVVGAGGFGRETLDVIEAINAAAEQPVYELLGVLDDAPSTENLDRLTARNVPHLGGVSGWLSHRNTVNYLVAIGNPSIRRQIVKQFDDHELASPSIAHPTAVIGSQVAFGVGVVVCAGVQVATNVRLGNHVHLNANATIGHDSTLSEFVSVNPAATVSGECAVEEAVLVGAASVILQGLTISAGATVGAGACVVRNVAAGAIVKGVPAR